MLGVRKANHPGTRRGHRRPSHGKTPAHVPSVEEAEPETDHVGLARTRRMMERITERYYNRLPDVARERSRVMGTSRSLFL